VSALDFSRLNANLLAVGMKNGSIALYDVRKKGSQPVLDNAAMFGKHRDPVWELRWVPEEQLHSEEEAKSEVLVSVSTDGRVVQWSTRKGWEHRGNFIITLK
jgi:WD40 repeat protein